MFQLPIDILDDFVVQRARRVMTDTQVARAAASAAAFSAISHRTHLRSHSIPERSS
jgi:hypothetical protein